MYIDNKRTRGVLDGSRARKARQTEQARFATQKTRVAGTCHGFKIQPTQLRSQVKSGCSRFIWELTKQLTSRDFRNCK